MTTKIFTKPALQGVLTQLRQAGYRVEKTNSGYKAFIDATDDTLVLQAMIGHRGYLVRFDPQLFSIKEYK